MDRKKVFSSLCAAVLIMAGCASANDTEARSLQRQQSATIESLNNEILRLNQELEGKVNFREDLQAAKSRLEGSLAEQTARGDVRVVLDPRGLVVTVLDHALFDPDETQFTSAGEEILKKIAPVLSGDLSEHRVMLEGHTDDQPIKDAGDVTNWEYSVGRAIAVLHYFLDVQKLSPEKFGVAGYAEYQPVASNATEEGRDRNRRVEIVIAHQKVA
jgi:chemotaxis protein MotB